MNCAEVQLAVSGRGIQVHGATVAEVEAARPSFLDRLHELGLDQYVQASGDTSAGSPVVEFRLREEFAVYMIESGRVCVAALNTRNIDYSADCIGQIITRV